MTTPLLKVSGLKVAYGGIQAVKGASFEVFPGELVSLIGANGAGKTTTLKAITGTQPVAEGRIEYAGRSIEGQGAWDLVRQCLVMVPGGRGTFTRMTILENLQMGAFIRNDGEVQADIDKVFALFPRLKERAKQLALQYPALPVRTALHVAVMQLHGVATVLSFDPGFDRVPGLTRLR